MNESTRVMTAGVGTMERTMVAPAGGATTRMGMVVECGVCRTPNSELDSFCNECGFLLASSPGDVGPEPEPVAGGFSLTDTTGRQFRLKLGDNSVGREGTDVILMDGTVSRRHAVLRVEDESVSVMDMGSTNGTFVSGSRIPPQIAQWLTAGMTVKFGSTELTVQGPQGLAEATINVSAPSVETFDRTMLAVPPQENSAANELIVQAESPALDEAPHEPVEPQSSDTIVSHEQAGSEVVGIQTGGLEPAGSDAAGVAQSAPIDKSAGPPEGAVPAVARLTATTGGLDDLLIAEGENTLGRRPSNDLVIGHDPFISGKHAVIEANSSGCYLTDSGSTNGTSVNGRRLEPNDRQLLLDGDEVTFGKSAYRYETLLAPENDD